MQIITRISTSSITVTPETCLCLIKKLLIRSFMNTDVLFILVIIIFMDNILPFLNSQILIEKSAGTITIAKTMINIKNSGITSFVPASSPSFFARFFLSSKASSASLPNSSVSPFDPFLRFWESIVPNFL